MNLCWDVFLGYRPNGLNPRLYYLSLSATKAGSVKRLGVAESSGVGADNRLPHASLGRVECGDGVVEVCDGADVCP